MKTPSILNDPPYGTERSYNGPRLAGQLVKREGEEVRVFLIGDAACCAKRNQQGFYNVEVNALRDHHAQRGRRGMRCLHARGIAAEELAEGCHHSSMEELADWTTTSERVLVF